MKSARERAETVVANWKEDKSRRPVHLVDYVEAAISLAMEDMRAAAIEAVREEQRTYNPMNRAECEIFKALNGVAANVAHRTGL